MPLAEDSAWDICHNLVKNNGAQSIEFAEPDLRQQWIVGDKGEQALTMAGACDQRHEQNKNFEYDKLNPNWFRDADHSQLAEALANFGDRQFDTPVRIAHLDTGYDPGHSKLPIHLNHDLQRNFVEGENSNDASDQVNGPLGNPGHGTGTLSILAGSGIGGAPFAEVVPLRVANSVVLFYTSAIARALDYVHQLCRDPRTRIHIVTMSMGGLASKAWADAINALYVDGVFVVTAAGNNFGNLPTRNIVYPARFNRVIAACGVMANHKPYADLDFPKMAGNYGPENKMRTALAAYTPNIPWARLGCPQIVDEDGAGTSAATPQIAAAAAIWIQQNLDAWNAYSQGWMRVEAVRNALFASARDVADRSRLGRGELRANNALEQLPVSEDALTPEPPDSASFPILRTLFGIGLDAQQYSNQSMLELEALQLSQSTEIEALLSQLPDSIQQGTFEERNRFIAKTLMERPGGSFQLREILRKVQLGALVPPPAPEIKMSRESEQRRLKHALSPMVPAPSKRRLQVYAYDPLLGTNLDTFGINKATLNIRWEEDLLPGPIGEYLEVVDVDPASRCCYAPIDLNHPHLLVQDGLRPCEGNPQFHQQMIYAVAMKTIEHFENSLGRVALWSSRLVSTGKDKYDEHFIKRLRIYPHALREANAYYSPDRKALLFGYFRASSEDSGDFLPDGLVFTALSHDIIAHETTHALLDGLHRRFREPTNPDALAFHEAFADIVALFQHFTLPEALRQQMAKTRGDLGSESLLGQLAVQFGMATNRYGALRDAVGELVKDEKSGVVWIPNEPNPSDYQDSTEPHKRGAVLVAAVFDAFLQIYRVRTVDLLRLATGGTGILPPGAISTDLVECLTQEATKVAGQVLRMCIRALDYCPPVDITFGEYLRALITADLELVPDDPWDYRVAFVSAFRSRGIYPKEVQSLSIESLMWEEASPTLLPNLPFILEKMSLNWNLAVSRERAFEDSKKNAFKFWKWLMDSNQVSDEEFELLGLLRIPKNVPMVLGDTKGEMRRFEVHSVRPARRIGPGGQTQIDLVVEITQTFRPDRPLGGRFRGGVTLLIDLENNRVRYIIRKRANNNLRFSAQQEFDKETKNALRDNYFDETQGLETEPFALLHRH